jgi:chloramphenicol 3-O-phosphotransferase
MNVKFLLLGCALFFGIGSGIFLYLRFSKKECEVTILSGTSSAGKSTLAAEIKKNFEGSVCVVALDDVISQIVAQKARALGWHEQMAESPWECIKKYVRKKTGKYVFDYQIRTEWLDYQPLYDAVKSACAQNDHVVVDTIIESSKQYDDLLRAVSGKKVTKKLVYCPLQVFAQRIKNRADMASFSGFGISLATCESFMAMYTTKALVQGSSAVDEISAIEIKKLLDESIQVMLQAQTDEQFVESKQYAQELSRRFLKQFGGDSVHAKIAIYPAFIFDEIVISSSAS